VKPPARYSGSAYLTAQDGTRARAGFSQGTTVLAPAIGGSVANAGARKIGGACLGRKINHAISTGPPTNHGRKSRDKAQGRSAPLRSLLTSLEKLGDGVGVVQRAVTVAGGNGASDRGRW